MKILFGECLALFISLFVVSVSSKGIPQVKGDCALGQSARFCSPYDYCVAPSSTWAIRNVSEPAPTVIACPGIWKVGSNCYDENAVCEVQTNGKCGWTNKGAFAECLRLSGAEPSEPVDPESLIPTQLDNCKAIITGCSNILDKCVDEKELPSSANTNGTLNNTNVISPVACQVSQAQTCFQSKNATCKRFSNNNTCGWDYSAPGFAKCLGISSNSPKTLSSPIHFILISLLINFLTSY